MLDFQLTTFKHKEGLQTGVLLTPSPNEVFNFPISSENLFLYTGNLYGRRNPDHFFKAFKEVLKVHPDAQFILIGSKMKLRHVKKILTSQEREHIQIMKHTNNLAPLFARAKVLVDIDADLEKDPFLSSKIVSYIKVNRIILSETGKDTPSRDMFKGLNTVIQCDHNAESLYQGMLKALELSQTEQDYSERADVIQKFSIEQVGLTLYNDLQKLTNKSNE